MFSFRLSERLSEGEMKSQQNISLKQKNEKSDIKFFPKYKSWDKRNKM
jgi:hypothetical protein